MKLNEYFAAEHSTLWARQSQVDPEETCRTFKPLRCADLFQLSAQAKDNLQCLPKSNRGPFTHVELWDVSQAVPELEPYAKPHPGDQGVVYRMVPVKLVESILSSHGEVKPVDAW